MFPANITCFVKNKTSFNKKRKHVRIFSLLKNQMTESKNETSQVISTSTLKVHDLLHEKFQNIINQYVFKSS